MAKLSRILFFVLLTSLLSNCENKSNGISDVKSPNQVQLEVPAVHKTHHKDNIFEACTWVWGEYYQEKKKKKKKKKKKTRIVKNPVRAHTCNTQIITKNIIVDSFKVCHPFDSDFNGNIVLYMNGQQQVFELEYANIDNWKIETLGCSGNDICFGHYNNDNYLDFRILSGSGSSGVMYNIYIYNKKKQAFELNKILSSEYTLRYNRKKNIYQSGGRGGSCHFQNERFIIKNGKKKILKAIYVSCEPNNKGDYFTTRKFVIGRDTFTKTLPSNKFDEYLSKDDEFQDFVNFGKKYCLK